MAISPRHGIPRLQLRRLRAPRNRVSPARVPGRARRGLERLALAAAEPGADAGGLCADAGAVGPRAAGAGGTGDLAALLYKRLQPNGRIVVSDINPEMLAVGEKRLADKGMLAGVEFVEANAEELPFPDQQFDLVTLAFGIRNMTHPERALAEIYRVLKVGGRALILEFSHPRWPGLQQIYDLYSFNILPKIGEIVAKDRDSYQYLVESIRRFPDQDTFRMMMEDAGFARVDVHNLSGGIVAIHRGFRLD